jgi:hypothetical protein
MMKTHFLVRGSTLCFAASLLAAVPAIPPKEAAARALESVPAWFEPNQGGARKEVKYHARGAGYLLSMEQAGAVVTLMDGTAAGRVRISLAGGNPDSTLEAEEPLPGRTDYILGNRPGQWKLGVPHFGRVRYRSAYPGIDLVYYGNGRQLEYDFVVSPGADPSSIRVRFQGAQSVRVDNSGSLVVTVGGRELRQPRPSVYQRTGDRQRVEIGGRYIVSRGGEVSFALGRYDRSRLLVIDPVLTYAGYFGGDEYDMPTGIAVDGGGNLWVTGTTLSIIEAVEGTEPYQAEPKANTDAFVAKLRLGTTGPPTLLYWTYFGGSGYDYGGLIEVDAAGKVYLTGTTYSADFPRSDNALLSTYTGSLDGFAAKLAPGAAGAAALVYSTLLGGIDYEVTTALFVEPGGAMLVGGYTASVDIAGITADALQPSNRGGWDAFVFRIDPSAAIGAKPLFATYFGGESTEFLTGVASDASGAIYISGYTMSDDLPMAGDFYQGDLRGQSDLFVAKMNPALAGLDRLVYGTYLGGSRQDASTAMTFDPAGRVWLTGYTMSADFPVTTGAYQAAFAGGETDAFLTCLDLTRPAAQAITYSTLFGGSGADVVYALALARSGKVAVAGYTLSDNLPLKDAPPKGQSRSLDTDGFVALLRTDVGGAGALLYSTYFGGSQMDVASRLAIGPGGNIFVSGYTRSKGLPVTDGSERQTQAGSITGFLLRLDPLPGEDLTPVNSTSGEHDIGQVPVVSRRPAQGSVPQTPGERR